MISLSDQFLLEQKILNYSGNNYTDIFKLFILNLILKSLSTTVHAL